MPRTSPPQPACTARYRRPLTVNVVGGATMPELTCASHRSEPFAASRECISRPLLPPLRTSPPPVASIDPQFGVLAYSCVHTFWPVSTFHACPSPPTWPPPGAANGCPDIEPENERFFS